MARKGQKGLDEGYSKANEKRRVAIEALRNRRNPAAAVNPTVPVNPEDEMNEGNWMSGFYGRSR